MAQYLLFMALVFLLAGQSHGNTSQIYTLSDLEILVQEGNHREFFKHALDVRPSERLDGWKSMVSTMALSYAGSLANKKDLTREEFRTLEELMTWPSLRADDQFRFKRTELGLRHLTVCLKTQIPCYEDVRRFWENDPSDPEAAVKLAGLLENHKDSPISNWSLLENAFKSPLSEFFCQKPLVMKTLWEKLELDYIRVGKEGDISRKVAQTVHQDCLPFLMKEARLKLQRPGREGERELAFQLLKGAGQLNQSLTDYFYTVYLLERPAQGELFNYAWNNLRELARSPDRRDGVLQMLKVLDPLPDDVMGSLDQRKKRAVLVHFKQNFPEYLDHYARLCMGYYSGKQQFTNGNPTLHCSELIPSELGADLFGTTVQKEFQDVRKI